MDQSWKTGAQKFKCDFVSDLERHVAAKMEKRHFGRITFSMQISSTMVRSKTKFTMDGL
jgi:hypothetical protein